jgi:hypothetical protein
MTRSHSHFDPADEFLMTMWIICLGMVMALGAIEYRHELFGITQAVPLFREGSIVP